MHVRAGRKAGRADEADDLALPHVAADIEAAGEGGHVAVGGLIAVGMADADIFAVAAFDPDLVDSAVAGGEDRRAEGRRPIDAGMRLHIVQQRMVALAEARAHDADRHRLAHRGTSSRSCRSRHNSRTCRRRPSDSGSTSWSRRRPSARRSAPRCCPRRSHRPHKGHRTSRRAAPCAGSPHRRNRCGPVPRSPAAACCCATRSRRCSDRAARRCRRPRRHRRRRLGDIGVDVADIDRDVVAAVGERDRRFDALSPEMMTRSGCMWPRPAAAVSTRSFWPSLRPPSRARAKHRKIALISSGAAPSSRRIEPTVSPFFADDGMLAPVGAAMVFGRSVMFSGTTRASKPT